MVEKAGHEKTLVLVKALPYASGKHGETVCCAGLTIEGEWRRLYPIRYRHLSTGFKRWDWVEYDWQRPSLNSDKRWESRRVKEETIKVTGSLTKNEQAEFLSKVLVPSYEEAFNDGKSLCLLKPQKPRFYWKKKTKSQIEREKLIYESAANQLSFFDKELKALNPTPYEFKFEFEDSSGPHDHSCMDWETSATFFKWRMQYDEPTTLKHMEKKFGEEFPQKGMVFAMGTHSKRPQQWLLIGVIRCDEVLQLGLGI